MIEEKAHELKRENNSFVSVRMQNVKQKLTLKR